MDDTHCMVVLIFRPTLLVIGTDDCWLYEFFLVVSNWCCRIIIIVVALIIMMMMMMMMIMVTIN